MQNLQQIWFTWELEYFRNFHRLKDVKADIAISSWYHDRSSQGVISIKTVWTIARTLSNTHIIKSVGRMASNDQIEILNWRTWNHSLQLLISSTLRFVLNFNIRNLATWFQYFECYLSINTQNNLKIKSGWTLFHIDAWVLALVWKHRMIIWIFKIEYWMSYTRIKW